jgi:hypothetical protein
VGLGLRTPYGAVQCAAVKVKPFLSCEAKAAFPGRSAARSGALQTRDLYELRVWDDPGSAVHRFALHRIRETILQNTLTRRPSSPILRAMYGLNLICGICREIIG